MRSARLLITNHEWAELSSKLSSLLARLDPRDFDSRVIDGLLAYGFCGFGLIDEFIPGTHQTFASVPIIEDASTRFLCAKPIPRDPSFLAKLLGALQDRRIINVFH